MNHVVKPNEFFFANILSKYHVASSTINFISRESKSIFNLNKIKAGNNLTVLYTKNDSAIVPQKMIYEENKVDYVVFNLDSSKEYLPGHNQVEHKHREVSGVINSSLYETLESNNMNPALAIRLSEILRGRFDFYKIQQGDRFKWIYDEDFVGDESVAVAKSVHVCSIVVGKIIMRSIMKKIKDKVGTIMMRMETA